MDFKKKWNKFGIKKKTFIFSVVVILIAFTVLYFCMNILIPKFFYNYKVEAIENEIDTFNTKLSNENIDDIWNKIDEFSFQNGLMINIKSDDNKWVYSTFKKDFNGTIQGRQPEIIPFKEDEDRHKQSFRRPAEDFLMLEKSFYFKNIDKNCTMIIRAPIKSINEMEILARLFFPCAFITILIVAITIAVFYSKYISNPLIKIKEAAEGMAALDFTKKIEPMGEDEIGALAISLNTMNKNLDKSFNELDSLNKQLQVEIEKERAIEKERREFIATISHELKSPITIISGQLEGMIYNIGKYKDREKYLKESYSVVEKMRDLVSELLDISKRDTMDFELKLEEINLSKLVKEVLRENYYFIEEKNLKLQEDIVDTITIKGDRLLLKKAIGNIIKNAINHSPIKENILVTLNENNLNVTNTGVEIPKEEMDNIFKAFYRLDKARSRKDGNTGLGLYIVKTILDKHENISYTLTSINNEVSFNMKF